MKRSLNLVRTGTLHFAMLALTSSIASLTSTSSHASPFSLGAGLSLSEGIGVEARYQISDKISVRSAWYGFNENRTEKIGNINFDLDLNFSHIGAFIDYQPLDIPLRLTAGVLYNNDQLKGIGLARNGYYKVSSYRIPEEQIGDLNASAQFNRLQTWLGAGYDLQLNNNLTLSSEVGVLFQGSADVRYDISGPIQNNADFASVLAQEEQAARDELDDYSYRPIAKVALLYRF